MWDYLVLALAVSGWAIGLYLYARCQKQRKTIDFYRSFDQDLLFQVFESEEIEADLDKIASTIASAFKLRTFASRVRIFVKPLARQQDWFQTQPGTVRYSGLAQQDIRAIYNFLDKVEQSALTVDQISRLDKQVHKILLSYRIDVVLALRINDRVISFLSFNRNKGQAISELVKSVNRVKTADQLCLAILLSAKYRDYLIENNQRLSRLNQDMTKQANISERQLARLDKAKDEFVSMMSHQLRTPLTSIKGYLSLILEGDFGQISAKQREMLNEVFKSSEQMAHTINDFLNVSRLQTGRFLLEKDVVDLQDLIAEEVNNAQHYITDSKQIQLKIIGKPASKMNIDKSKIAQAIGNLLDNALYYSLPSGKIKVELAEVDGRIEVKINDDGIGVPESERDDIFQKFYRADNAKKQRPDGAGIGLYLVREIVLAHHGQVFYKPLDKGSEFGFWLPVDRRLNYNKIEIKE